MGQYLHRVRAVEPGFAHVGRSQGAKSFRRVPCSSCGRSAAQRRHPPHPAQYPGGWLPVSRVAQPAARVQGSAAAATCATAELVRDTDVAYPACRSRRALVESGLVESASGSLARAAATAGAVVAARWRKDPRAGMGALALVDSKWESRLWSSEAMAALPAVDARRPRAARSYRAICAVAARHLGHRPLAASLGKCKARRGRREILGYRLLAARLGKSRQV